MKLNLFQVPRLRGRLLLLLLPLLMGIGPAFAEDRPAATVAYVEGNVRFRPSATAAWKKSAEGDTLMEHAEIMTGTGDSLAVLVFWDKSIVKMAASSHVILTELADAPAVGLSRRFKLKAGRIWSDVEKSSLEKSTFKVETPHGVASVRGTSFEVTAQPDRATVQVWEGQVDFQSAKSQVRLKQYDRLEASGRESPGVSRFDPSHADAWQRWNLETRQSLRNAVRAGGGGASDEVQKVMRDASNRPNGPGGPGHGGPQGPQGPPGTGPGPKGGNLPGGAGRPPLVRPGTPGQVPTGLGK